jgi:hypothetical protein
LLFAFLTWRALNRGPQPAQEIVVLGAFALFTILGAAQRRMRERTSVSPKLCP